MLLRSLTTRLVPTQKAQLLSLAQRSLPSSAVAPAHYFSYYPQISSSAFPSVPTSRLPSPHSYLPIPLSTPVLLSSTLPAAQHTLSPNASKAQQFEFVVSASWKAKPKPANPKNPIIKNNLAHENMAHIFKADAGEDAFFHTSTPSGLALGVADGVGGWIEIGVDPSMFSWTLMNNAAAIAKDPSPFLQTILPPVSSSSSSSPTASEFEDDMKPPSLHAKEILSHAFEALVSSGCVTAGSSTACILDLCNLDGTMTSSNLGDSSFLLIRGQQVLYESPSQQHYFNCPYQLSVIPEDAKNRGNYICDSPRDADSQTFQLMDGDVIILATDGFFDNVYSHEALNIVNKEFEDVDRTAENVESMKQRIQRLALELTNTALRYSQDQKRVSPWSHLGSSLYPKLRGGKVDDITCIVTFVQTV